MWLQTLNADHPIQTWQNRESFLSTGCSRLDEFLNGGLSCKGITQVYGESGIGKTQLALQLCLSSQILFKNSNNTSGGTAYISTDAIFPSKRLQELSKKSLIAKNNNIDLEQIFIEHISNTKDLEDCIFSSGRLQYLLSKQNIKLLVIDSIAATYRYESDLRHIISRAKSLRKMGCHLQKLANLHKLAIVCLNQVTAVVENNSIGQYFTEEQPSLGITWANMVTNSLHMYKKNNRRYLYVAGSSYLSNKTMEYEILDSGIMSRDTEVLL